MTKRLSRKIRRVRCDQRLTPQLATLTVSRSWFLTFASPVLEEATSIVKNQMGYGELNEIQTDQPGHHPKVFG
jgi:hypothetical protein